MDGYHGDLGAFWRQAVLVTFLIPVTKYLPGSNLAVCVYFSSQSKKEYSPLERGRYAGRHVGLLLELL